MAANTVFPRGIHRRLFFATLVLSGAALSGPGLAQRKETGGLSRASQHEGRSFDARTALITGEALPGALQIGGLEALRAQLPDLDVRFDGETGATRTLWNRAGYLTAPDARAHRAIAESYIAANAGLLGLLPGDVADMEITDLVYSRVTGATHIYYRQRIHGIPVYNAQLHVNVNRAGRILSVNNGFLPDLTSAYNALLPGLDAAEAVRHAAAHLNVRDADVRTLRVERAVAKRTTDIDAASLSRTRIKAGLMLLPIRRGEARLIWNFQVQTPDSAHWYDFSVDADSGKVWAQVDWMASDQYRAYARPVESPIHASPAAPADGRATAVNPHHGVPSPFGWHDTNGVAGPEFTIHRGNNVHAYSDMDPAQPNTPPATQPDCGPSLDCSFPLDLNLAPSTYTAAAISNLFYWTNIIHDIQYQYGFDEAAGNFQVNNYGRGGAGNDDVQAEAQDAGGSNNANFATPPDGFRPRMQMYPWHLSTPALDGDFDNGIIVHEYGHGISNRLVGGPSNVSCLGNAQQPGEGLSDWWSLVYTARAGDTGPTLRGIGNYALAQPATAAGIRGTPYTTDTAVNGWTYESIAGSAIPHGVGAVWAQIMWRVYWALVDEHGFGTDLYNATGGYGNQRAMLYVNEGLKNTACSPTFMDVRDGILQAAADNYGGVDVCRMWNAFAAAGLGIDAFSGGPNSTTAANGFNTPLSCGGVPLPSLSIGDVTVTEGAAGTATSANFTVSLDSAAGAEVRVDYATVEGTATNGMTFTSGGPIALSDFGPASPYPSTLAVSGVPGTVQNLRVRLNGLTHSYVADLDVMLVGPAGQKVMLMSDVTEGARVNVSNMTLTFRDGAPSLAAPSPGAVYSPTDLFPGETMPAPAPPGPYPAELSAFHGTNPNGTWLLYVTDDWAIDAGLLTSWSLIFTIAGADDFAATSGQLVFPAGITSQTISVPVFGDDVSEPDETFRVALSGPVRATLADATGTATVADDDGATAPPGAATLAVPLRRIGFKPTYEWHAVPAATSYQLVVSDRLGIRIDRWYTAEQVGCLIGGLCAIAPDIALNAGDTYWWVRTWNQLGYGPWSAMGSFYVAAERFVIGLGEGGGEFQPWSSSPGSAAPQADAANGEPSAIVRQGSVRLPWPAYNSANGELHPAVGDVDGDGLDEIVVGLGAGGEGYMAIFDDAQHGFALLTWIQLPWPAYNSSNGTVWPAVGDLDGDGRAEIVAGLGQHGQGFVALFEDAASGFAFTTWKQVTWNHYTTTQSGETHPTVVNLDGGATSEIVIGLGPGGAGWLEILDDAAAGYAHLKWIQIGWPQYVAGAAPTFPAGGDIDGDGFGEIVVGLGHGSQGWVEVFEDLNQGAIHKSWVQLGWSPYNAGNGQTHPAVGNVDGDAAMEIVLGLDTYIAGFGGWFEVRDDDTAGHASLGWANVGRADFKNAGGGTYPAVGKVR